MKKLIGVLLIVIGVVITYVAVAKIVDMRNGAVDNYTNTEYYVEQGDTLFNIIGERVSDAHDIREYIYLTKKANPGLDPGNLEVGDKIILCLPKE